MTWQLLLMDANAIVCLLIMVRLMFFRKEGKRHRLSVAVLAYRELINNGVQLTGRVGYTANYAVFVHDPNVPQTFRRATAQKEFLTKGFEDNAFGLVPEEVVVVHAASSSVMVSSSLPPLTIGILFTL